MEWPTLCRVRDIQAFLGFANFYRWFIEGYLELTLLLTRLTKKNEPWAWTDCCRVAFDSLKTAFSTASILTHWDPNLPVIVETDVSDYALAAIISTHTRQDIYPIAFHSRAFSSTKLNYNIHNKELLTIFEVFKKWRHYLKGTITPVEVFTDHKNLTYFCKSKTLSHRQARWSEFLL